MKFRFYCIGFLSLVGIGASAHPVFADPWYEHYAKADKAIEEQNWTEAIAQINEALERKGDSGARVRTYGMKIISYFPYLKLGIAYYHLGQLDAALQAFETEERLGAIAQSNRYYGELGRYRRMAREAREAARVEETGRIRRIVQESIARAKELEAGGELDEAMSALGRGLAVEPDHRESLAMMEELRNQMAREQEARETDARVARLVEQGRSFLDARQYGDASSVLRQALELKRDDDTQSLLEEAQRRLRSQLDARNRQSLIAEALNQARQLEGAGQVAEALERLQSVLALDPSNQDALDVQTKLLRTQSAADEERTRRESLEELLSKAESQFQAGRYDECLSTSNRLLALDPGNANALQFIASAYQRINQRLLGRESFENMPPAIRFADFRQELEDGSQAQTVRSPDFRLSGVVIDNSPVEIVFYDLADRPIPATIRSQPLGDYTVTEFNLSYRLAPGQSTFRLTATDGESLNSSSEYIVVYDRPFFRSPGFYLLSSFALVALGVLAVVRRTRHRAKLLKRRFNPYVAGAPVLDDKLFIGRERLIDRILQTIHNNSLLLYGERRIGKTSVQHHLKRRLEKLQDPDYDFYPVYIDLQGVPEERFFSTIAEDIFQDLAPVLNGLPPSAPPSDRAYSYRDLVRDIPRVLRALKQRSSKQVRLVLLMDEVDVLNEYDPKVNQRLRSLFMKSFAENLVAVVSGVEIKKHWEGEGSPWYNFFEEIEIRPLPRDDAEELIERPIHGVFAMEKGVAERIISLTDGKPYLIQKLCVALINRLHDENRRTLTLSDVDAVGRPEEA